MFVVIKAVKSCTDLVIGVKRMVGRMYKRGCLRGKQQQDCN
jgi:hypothetical protein